MLTALSVASTVGSGVAQVVSQAQAAKAQAKAQLQASANLAAQQAHKYTEQNLAQSQKEIGMAMEAQEAQREGQEVVASAITSAEESHTGGTSVGLLADNLDNSVLEFGVMQQLKLKLDNTALLLARQGGGLAYAEQYRRLNPPIAGPDIAGIALSTATQAMGQYQSGQLYESQRGNFALQGELFSAQNRTAQANLQAAGANLSNQRASLGLTNLRTQTAELQLEQALLRRKLPQPTR
jgi:hypothetical protein